MVEQSFDLFVDVACLGCFVSRPAGGRPAICPPTRLQAASGAVGVRCYFRDNGVETTCYFPPLKRPVFIETPPQQQLCASCVCVDTLDATAAMQ